MSRIIVIDEVWPKTGMVEAYRRAYLEDYAPVARERGMTLESVLISPPLILAEGGNRITFIWSLPDVAAFWKTRFGDDEQNLGWWARGASLAERQERSFHADFMEPADAR